eukprot:9719755-Alexandrium_andersonii.AAC.1
MSSTGHDRASKYFWAPPPPPGPALTQCPPQRSRINQRCPWMGERVGAEGMGSRANGRVGNWAPS